MPVACVRGECVPRIARHAPRLRRSATVRRPVVYDRSTRTSIFTRLFSPPPMVPLPRARPDACDASIAVLVPEGDTVARKGDPVSVVRAWSQGLGFEGLSYFAPARDPAQGAMTLWSTWGARWDIAYRLRRHADVDPRIVATRDRTLPCLWEGGSIVAHGRLARFLREAGDCGIRSGVAIPLGTSAPRAIVAFDASQATLSEARRSAILARLGDLLWVAHAVHASRHATAPAETAA